VLMPKRVKFRRQHRPGLGGKSKAGTKIEYGELALQSLDAVWITSRQIEAARIAMTRHVKRGGQVWIRIFPDRPITQKPAETRMGSGKGAPEYWVSVVKPGRILFELAGVPEDIGREALRLASHKLPCRTKILKREEAGEAGDS
jgi:large subunit ribosomal protein L16